MTIKVPTPESWLKLIDEDGEIDRNDIRGILWTLLYSDSTNVKAFRKLCGMFCTEVPDTIEGIHEKARTELIPRLQKYDILPGDTAEMYLDPAAHGVELQSANV